ncbi:MAG: type II toxin-antitoxin system prevent-host-death family antitoxin [Actinomycetota bacterium]
MSTHVVNTHEAKSRLSELIRAAEAGDDVIVARNGEPVARIVAWQPESKRRSPGAWSGRVRIDDDIVTSDPEIVALFDESPAT